MQSHDVLPFLIFVISLICVLFVDAIVVIRSGVGFLQIQYYDSSSHPLLILFLCDDGRFVGGRLEEISPSTMPQ